MIKFKWYVTENNQKIIIEKNNIFTIFDSPKNAATICYLLLTGNEIELDGDDDCPHFEWTQIGDQKNLKHIVDNYRYSEYMQSVFTSVFFEEINLLFFINNNFK